MPDLLSTLNARFADAFASLLGEEHRDADPILRPSANPKFGDYQSNCAMGLAKKLKRKPRDLAEQIIEAIDLGDVCEKVEIAGPGFINLTFSGAFLAEQLSSLASDASLGVRGSGGGTVEPETIVVDYSSPNVAKEMHVGHLRSTIIGDAITRVLEAQGHTVIRQNHVGDWGTQFGMLIENLLDQGFDPATSDASAVGDLTRIYKQSKQRFDDDADFTQRARERVVKLQGGDETTLAVWRALVEASKTYFQSVYGRLDVLLSPDDVCGESFYNDRLPGVVQKLEEGGQLHESEGARVVYPEGFKDRDDNPLGMIVQKSDGGYLYATTDLAAAMYRVNELHADRVVYVIGLPQKQHFEMFTQTLRQAGWLSDDVRMAFAGFGSVLGEDGKMFKTRSGDTVRLIDLINEAETRAYDIVKQKTEERGESMTDEQLREIAHVVGVGALKYADLSSDRVKDYTFSWDRMLSFDGNTAPYLLNAYVRVRAIFRRGDVDPASVNGKFEISTPHEKRIAVKLLQFGDVVGRVADAMEPHQLCTYLYELAAEYHSFFEACPVLKADTEAQRDSRLKLCDTTANVLKQGLGMLGIGTVERM